MRYASGTEGHGAATAASSIYLDPSHPNFVLIPDAQLLFTAEFHRAGPDLVLIGQDGHHLLIPGYFSSEIRPALVTASGAGLPPHMVDLLVGSPTPNEYAQAQPATPPDFIGKVEKVIGD